MDCKELWVDLCWMKCACARKHVVINGIANICAMAYACAKMLCMHVYIYDLKNESIGIVFGIFNWLSPHHTGDQPNTVIHTVAAAAAENRKINSYQNSDVSSVLSEVYYCAIC